MSDEKLITTLETHPDLLSADLTDDMRHFLGAISTASRAPLEEAVPAEMMQVFSDEQWPRLLFEFQPGATLFGSGYDVASVHQGWIENGSFDIPHAGESLYWLIYSDAEGLIVRMVNPQEYRGLEMAAGGASFSEMAAALWPDLAVENAHHQMTEMLMIWLNDGLIIDAGVPLPEDAEFEDDQ